MSKLEKAIVAIVEVFQEYAGMDEKKHQLSNSELSQLIQKELSSPSFQDKVDKENIKEVLENIDKNKDNCVNFCEFSQCVAGLARGFYKANYGKDKLREKCTK